MMNGPKLLDKGNVADWSAIGKPVQRMNPVTIHFSNNNNAVSSLSALKNVNLDLVLLCMKCFEG
jgi:hypothetical protein